LTLSPPICGPHSRIWGCSALSGRFLVGGNVQSHAMPSLPDGFLSARRARMVRRLVTDRDTSQVRVRWHIERQAVRALRAA
jgi:hypothetical protein